MADDATMAAQRLAMAEAEYKEATDEWRLLEAVAARVETRLVANDIRLHKAQLAIDACRRVK